MFNRHHEVPLHVFSGNGPAVEREQSIFFGINSASVGGSPAVFGRTDAIEIESQAERRQKNSTSHRTANGEALSSPRAIWLPGFGLNLEPTGWIRRTLLSRPSWVQLRFPFILVFLLLEICGCSATPPPAPATAGGVRAPASTSTPEVRAPASPPPAKTWSSAALLTGPLSPSVSYHPATVVYPIMLGIDVLAADHFAPLAGKRIALLTHPAGVNRYGVSTVEVLRHAPKVKLVALFGPEHGIYGDVPAGALVADAVDKRTGLPAYSLYGKNNHPTKTQLKGVDVFVIDLQDIGVRSYTFSVCMRYAIEACFENNVEVLVLDRPNPLGGIKVDGPALEREWMSGVGAYRIPYVHGLTMGELATMAAKAPGVLEVPEPVRARGKLTVIPMRGWRRGMRWPETGLTFVPTSPKVQDFAACVGYAMTGMGCEYGGFSHGVGNQYPFRGISFNGKPVELVLKELEALHLSGLAFRKVSVPNKVGQPATGIYIEVTDWDDWHPTELSFHLMRLACKLSGKNPYAFVDAAQARKINIITGSTEWWNALRKDGAKVDVESWVKEWQRRNLVYQQLVRRYWLYN